MKTEREAKGDTEQPAPRWHSKVATGARQVRVRHSPADNTHRKEVRQEKVKAQVLRTPEP